MFELYYYLEKEKRRVIDEEERKRLIREKIKREEEIRRLKFTISIIILLLTNLRLWQDREIFNRNKEKLEFELFILKAVQKIKEQLLLRKDTELILTPRELENAKEIQNRLTQEGIYLKNDLTRLEENKGWNRKLERDKELSKTYGIGLSIKTD